jgi:hypothetical protein
LLIFNPAQSLRILSGAQSLRSRILTDNAADEVDHLLLSQLSAFPFLLLETQTDEECNQPDRKCQ